MFELSDIIWRNEKEREKSTEGFSKKKVWWPWKEGMEKNDFTDCPTWDSNSSCLFEKQRCWWPLHHHNFVKGYIIVFIKYWKPPQLHCFNLRTSEISIKTNLLLKDLRPIFALLRPPRFFCTSSHSFYFIYETKVGSHYLYPDPKSKANFNYFTNKC